MPSPRKPCPGAPQTCSTRIPIAQTSKIFAPYSSTIYSYSPPNPLNRPSILKVGQAGYPLGPPATERSSDTRATDMSTLRQIEANRRNAQKSTGPTSVTGKAAPTPSPPVAPTRQPSSRRLYPLHPKLLHPKLASFRRPPFPPSPSRRPPRRIPAGRRLSVPLPLPCALRFATLASKRIVHPLPRRTLAALYEQK